jgi:hypothetical protein
MRKLEFKASDDPMVGYLYLAGHPGPGSPGCAVRQLRLDQAIGDYKGPPVYLDFDHDGQLIGIEIVG